MIDRAAVADEAGGVPDRGRRLVVRAPNHLGELVLAIPALLRVVRREWEAGREPPLIQLTSWLCPLLRLVPDLAGAEVLPVEDRHAVRAEAKRLRRAAAGRRLEAITLSPSFSSALILRLAGVDELRGTAGGGRTALLTDRVDRGPLLAGHRVNEFLVICRFEPEEPPDPPRLASPGPGADFGVQAGDGPVVGLFPGANGPARRWPEDRFAELARRLGGSGARIIVLGGPSETAATGAVAAAGGERGVDLGGKTSIEGLAGVLEACDLLVTNDTGPMHVAAALGRPVLALMGPGDRRQTGPLGPAVRVIGRFDLPCVPCVKNDCPRSGVGTILPHAERECMYLIGVDEVEAAVHEMLSKELQ